VPDLVGSDLDVLAGFLGTSPKNWLISTRVECGSGRKLSRFLRPCLGVKAGGIVPSNFIAFEGARVGVTGDPGTLRRGRTGVMGVNGIEDFRRLGESGVRGGEGPGLT